MAVLFLTRAILTLQSFSDFFLMLLFAGGARIPKIRETLAAFFQRSNVDLHLNGDDCVCMGCAFYAAMKSNAFKKQPFKFRDITLFPVSYLHPAVGGDTSSAESRELFPFQVCSFVGLFWWLFLLSPT